MLVSPPQYWKGLQIKDNDIVRSIFFVFWFLSEPIRMAAGFYGNLHENVSCLWQPHAAASDATPFGA